MYVKYVYKTAYSIMAVCQYYHGCVLIVSWMCANSIMAVC